MICWGSSRASASGAEARLGAELGATARPPQTTTHPPHAARSPLPRDVTFYRVPKMRSPASPKPGTM